MLDFVILQATPTAPRTEQPLLGQNHPDTPMVHRSSTDLHLHVRIDTSNRIRNLIMRNPQRRHNLDRKSHV